MNHQRFYKQKTIFPHRYSKMFHDYWWTHTAFWNAMLERLRDERDVMVLVSGDTGCQPKGSKVLMADGSWKNIEDLREGDEIISPQKDGSLQFSKILSTVNFQSPQSFNVVQNGRNHKKLYSCNEAHFIPFYHQYHKRATDDKGKRYYVKSWWDFKEYRADEIIEMYQKGFSHQNIGFSCPGIKEYKDVTNCEIEPYCLGVYLGDGHFTDQLVITSDDPLVLREVAKHYNLMNIVPKKGTSCKTYCFSLRDKFAKVLEKFGLRYKHAGKKFIPQEAMRSDINYRKRLLAGLIDTDSYYKDGGYEYVSKSKMLVENIRDLVFSIGGRCYEIKEVTKGIKKTGFVGKYYKIQFYLGNIELPLLTERRKRNTKCFYKEPNRIAIFVEKDIGKKMYGFELDSESHWYITDNWMVTKNSGKSHFTGTIAFKKAMQEDNFVLNDGTKMFIPEENFIISPEEFAYKMITKEGQFLWGDEFRRGANRRDWYSPINKAILDRKNANRKLFNIYFLCMPFESEFDPKLASHLHVWIWVRRGVGEVYIKRSGVKGGTGLNIATILEREQKYLKENPKKTLVPPIIHPEYCGRIAFNKLTAGLERQYKELVKAKKAVGDLTDEEKERYGLEIKKEPKKVVSEVVEKIKNGEIKDKLTLWNSLDSLELEDGKKEKLLNFYLNIAGFPTFKKLFDKKKLDQIKVDW